MNAPPVAPLHQVERVSCCGRRAYHPPQRTLIITESNPAPWCLARLDRLFSRDQLQRRYVQDHLRDCTQTIREWLNIMTLPFMSAALIDSVRCRRDVY
ncbi:MAG: hypothetical protein AB7F79_05840 [Steroidobacteraceae bacterium]